MPRISAPTVAEHRAAQQRALLAARDLLAADPGKVPSLADIAKAGLARPSVYQYYRSREDLFAALVADIFPRWSRRITDAMAADRMPDAASWPMSWSTWTSSSKASTPSAGHWRPWHPGRPWTGKARPCMPNCSSRRSRPWAIWVRRIRP